jgi:amino acid adenylation domain-containing protein/FkbH-like protein/non-ribosomal peptide synthase protein (TIGR01720 family)
MNSVDKNTSLPELVFAVTANFTAEPLAEYIHFWMHQLALNYARTEFSGYNQVFQDLISPNSLLGSHEPGMNFVLLRFEDWARDKKEKNDIAVIADTTNELISTFIKFSQRATRPTVVFVAPPSKLASKDLQLVPFLQDLEHKFCDALQKLPNVSIICHHDLCATYPVSVVNDFENDKLAHIPFTREYWAALGTTLMRKAIPLVRKPYKVIAVDADNTLWSGVVGEAGAKNIEITQERLFLQHCLKEQKRRGMLLVLVSKNEESDVRAAFQRHEMVLRPEDFVAWKVNWDAKSKNLKALANELELGLDSFIFLDDNPVECAEVHAGCPVVTTLQLPSDTSQIPHFLSHVWPFDSGASTVVDEKRTELYQQQSARNQFRNAATTFRDFLNGLQLKVTIARPLSADLVRAAQLTQRTNQFNTTGIRRNVGELANQLETGARQAFLVHVSDRFGDYGAVGLAVFFISNDSLVLESFLLSCRVLGKGVEHQILAALGREAQKIGVSKLHIYFRRMDRNQPVERFLNSLQAQILEDQSFCLTAEDAASTVFDPETGASLTVPEDDSSIEGRVSQPQTALIDFNKFASELNSVKHIVESCARFHHHSRPQLPNPLVAPRNSHEAFLVALWEDVLHVTPIGVTDAFLSLGGQSLQAAMIASRIVAELGIPLPLTIAFAKPTISDLADYLRDATRTNRSSSLPKAKALKLSAAQQRLWFLDQFIPNRASYNIPLGWRIKGNLDPTALEEALKNVVLRHEVLRSCFPADGNGIEIAENPRCSFFHAMVASEADAVALAEAEARRPFDLIYEPVVRCLVVSWSSANHLVVLNIHHIASDGWSMGLIVQDWNDAYKVIVEQSTPTWEVIHGSYADYAEWQSDRFAGGEFLADLEYWKQELYNIPSLLELPTDNPRPIAMTYIGKVTHGDIAPSLARHIETLAEKASCTPFGVLLTAWQTLLFRYSQQKDIVIGVPVAGRVHSSLENVVGCFVNTVAIRASMDGNCNFLDQVRTNYQKVLGALEHQELPFENLVSELALERDLSHSPVFQVMLVLQNTNNSNLEATGLEITPVALHNGGAKFDLVLEITPQGDSYHLALEYNSNLFHAETAERMLRHFNNLLAHGCTSPEKSLGSLAIMDESEFRQTLTFVNSGNSILSDATCLHEWFERRAAISPKSVALTCDGESLTYAELNAQANRLARQLVEQGIRPDTLVGLCLDRTNKLVVAILAILKAGGAYLPIDLAYPADRLAFMLEDAQAPILLTETKLLQNLPPTRARVICVDDIMAQPLQESEAGNLPPISGPDNLAYVIYTSGTTGKPKGSLITHRNVSRLFAATEHWYHFNEKDVWTLFHSCAFDFSVWEIWGALFYGGRIVVVPFMVSRSPESFYELLVKEKVTVLNQTPSAFRQLIQAEESVGQKDLALRYVIFGGEALEMQSLRPWFDRHGDKQPLLVNMYGITETTVHVTYRPLSKNDVASGSVIGVPIPDLRIYILDPNRQLLPVGVPGEMYVGGAGLARGYLHREELTAERFPADHLTGKPGSRLYKTGDLARFLPNRDIEYLGRIDHQVKIRGFRIELGEIESVLTQHDSVRQASVVAREDIPGSKRLVAYLVATSPAPEVNVLREHLKKKVPDYMVPAAFVFMEKLPLTASGKIDFKALPAPEQQRPELGRRFVAPETPVEITLAAIWSKVLRVEAGACDNFFELGGDSILSIQIISLARREGLKLTPKLLFANPTIRELAAVAEVVQNATTQEETVVGDVPLTPIQKWFFEQNLAEAHHYNQAFLFESSEVLDRELLERALTQVNLHHDTLRLRYTHEANQWQQFYGPARHENVLKWHDLAGLNEIEQKQRIEFEAALAQASLDFEKGPLWHVGYFDLGTGKKSRLLIVVHHLAVDGISWRPLLEDLESSYQQLKSGKPVQLPPKTASFKTWASRLQNFVHSESLKAELTYWNNVTDPEKVADAITRLKMPGVSHANTEGSARLIEVSLSSEDTRALLQQVPAVYNTQINDVLLTALTRAWTQWTGSQVLFTNLEGHGRENLFDDVDLSRTVGWFTSIFPVRLVLPGNEKSWQPGEALKSVKEQFRQVPRRGIGYGLLRYLDPASSLAAQPEPSMVFNYLGQFDQVLAGSKLFKFAKESSGAWHGSKQRRRHILEMNCLVRDERLELLCTYSPEVHAEKEISEFANGFLDALKELIAHCQTSAGGRTPSDFPLTHLTQEKLDELVAVHRDLEDICPLSPIQNLFFSANPTAELVSFDQWHCSLEGALNVAAFQEAWRQTLARHTVLRSTIHGEGLSEPLQIVHRDATLPWTIEDWLNLEQSREQTIDAHWAAFLKQDRAKPIQLTHAPAMRFALVRTGERSWKFLWSVPALLLDGWSWPVVFAEASRLYEALSQKAVSNLQPARPYRDYLEWLAAHPQKETQEFWQKKLAGFREPTTLPIEFPGNDRDNGFERYARHSIELSSETTMALQSTARSLQLTVNTFVQGIWALLLQRVSGSSDVVFGSAFAGRPADLRGVESIVGPFVNNVPVRVEIKPELNASDFFRRMQANLLDLSSHQYMPLLEIQRSSEVPWQHRLFDSVVVFQNYLVNEDAQRFGKNIKIAEFVGPIHTNYAVMLLAEPGKSLRLTLIYDRQKLNPAMIKQWADGLAEMLASLPSSMEAPVANLQKSLSGLATATARRRKTLRAESQNFVPPQSEMERNIAGLWQEMFGLERVSIEENFFDLGGHSLLLVQMHSRLREKLHIEFPIVTLLEHPTIRSLARELGQSVAVSAAKEGHLQERAQRQKQALAQMRIKLKK